MKKTTETELKRSITLLPHLLKDPDESVQWKRWWKLYDYMDMYIDDYDYD